MNVADDSINSLAFFIRYDHHDTITETQSPSFIYSLQLSEKLQWFWKAWTRFTISILYAVVSEKNGIFICELIMERYIYLRNSHNQLKITSYSRNKSFLEFCLVYNCLCVKLLRSLLQKLGDFASLCIKIGGWFCITTFECFKYLLLPFCLHSIYCQDAAPHLLITLRSWQLPSVYIIHMRRHSLRKSNHPNVNTL